MRVVTVEARKAPRIKVGVTKLEVIKSLEDGGFPAFVQAYQSNDTSLGMGSEIQCKVPDTLEIGNLKFSVFHRLTPLLPQRQGSLSERRQNEFKSSRRGLQWSSPYARCAENALWGTLGT